MICGDCGMVDPYDGHGDGIGSCDCPRCERCHQPRWVCGYCDQDDRWDDEDDYGHGDYLDAPWRTAYYFDYPEPWPRRQAVKTEYRRRRRRPNRSGGVR